MINDRPLSYITSHLNIKLANPRQLCISVAKWLLSYYTVQF